MNRGTAGGKPVPTTRAGVGTREALVNFETIDARKTAEGVGIIVLRRPEKRNAISIRMRHEISHCLDRWATAPEVGAVIFRGEGEIFSAGFDLAELAEPGRFDELLSSSSRYHRDVWNFPKPTIAAVNGPALGGGFDLATLCDLRIGSETCAFAHPEIRLGAPPLFTPLRWIVGDGRARDLCLTGRTIAAPEAHRMGLVGEVVEGARLPERAAEVAATILAAPPETLRFTKAYLAGSPGRGFEESFQVEHDQAFREILRKVARERFGKKP